MNPLSNQRRLEQWMAPPVGAPAASTNSLPVANKANPRHVLRQRSAPTRATARSVFGSGAASGAHGTVSRQLENSLPAHGRRDALQPLPANGTARRGADAAQAPLHELSEAQITAALARTKSHVATYAADADQAMGYEGQKALNRLYVNKDSRLGDFKARAVFPAGTKPQNAPLPADDPTRSLPLNTKGTRYNLGMAQAAIAKHNYKMLAWVTQRDKKNPSQTDPKVRQLEQQLNAALDERFRCSIDTLGAVVLAQLFTRLDDLVKALNNASKDSIRFECAKELLGKIQHFQQQLKGMSALLTDPAFLAPYPKDLQDMLRDYGKSIGEMEDILSHGRGFEDGPLHTLTGLAQEVMRRTAPSSPAPQKPLPPTPAGRPLLSDDTRARDTVLRHEGAHQVVQPLVSPAKPLVIRIDNARKAAAAA